MGKMLSRRDFIRAGAAALGSAALAACAAPTPEVQVVEKEVVVKETVIVEGTPEVVEKIIVATVPPVEEHEISFAWWMGGESANKVFDESVERFALSHPNFTVTPMPMPYSEYNTKMLTMYGSGNAPDCHGLFYGTVWAWAHKGVLLDLTPLVERDAADVQWDDMWPAVNGELYYPPGTVTALPRETFGLMLTSYNKGLFAEAGLDTPDVDYNAGNWTWDVWREKAKQLTRFGSDGRREILGSSAPSVSYWTLQIAMTSYGVQPFNDDLTHYNLDDPRVVEWIALFPAMLNQDRSIPSPDDAQFDWASNGQQAIHPTYSWNIPNYRTRWNSLDWDFCPPPKGECCHTNFVGNDFHVVNGADYADRDGGWEMIKFLNSPAEDLWWATNMFGPPFRKSNLEPWTTKVSGVLPKEGWKYMEDMVASAVPWTPIPFQELIDNALANQMPQAVNGEQPVEEVVASIVSEIDEGIAGFE